MENYGKICIIINYGQGVTLVDANACIKAFTVDTGETAKPDEEDKVAVTGVKLNETSLTMQEGDKQNLVATITPLNATNTNVTWTSSNPEVASVSKTGIITALKKGNTVITVTTEDGNYKAVCNVTVTEKTNKDDEIYDDDKKDESGGEKGNEVDTPKENSKVPVDDTVASSNLPYTGVKISLVIAIIVSVIGIIMYKKYKKYDDIK